MRTEPGTIFDNYSESAKIYLRTENYKFTFGTWTEEEVFMRGYDILNKIQEKRLPEHIFIKWYRRENDFVDYDLIDRFIDNLSGNDEIEDIHLLTMDEVWGEIKRLTGDKVRKVRTDSGENVEWRHEGKSGVTTQTCPYTPATLMTIFDVETRGNAID